MPNQRLRYLFDRFNHGSSTPAENRELYALVLELQHEAYVQELLDEYWETQKIEFQLPADKSELMAEEILHHQPDESTIQPAKVRQMRAIWKKIAVAASVIMVIGLGSYYLFFDKSSSPAEVVQTTAPADDVKAPETNRAMITLADGQIIYLDNAANGSLAMIEDVQLVKQADGKISYTGSADEVVYHTLTNPRGSKVIDMTLSDGSRVWLNAASSVTFPVAFVGTERKVSIDGEAYFEIAHDASKPFKVTKGDVVVAVLGTHFNVEAYSDESEIQVTLLEGSVKVMNGVSTAILKPGQQAKATPNFKPQTLNSVDLEEVMAWKNNLFVFNGDKIQTVMSQVSRWYDVDVQYKGEITNEDFVGIVSRSGNVSQVLKMMERTKKVKFEFEGKLIVVSSP